MLLELVRFPQDARPGEVDPAIIQRLGIGFMPMIAALFLLAMAGLSIYRISREQREENLDASRERAEAS